LRHEVVFFRHIYRYVELCLSVWVGGLASSRGASKCAVKLWPWHHPKLRDQWIWVG